MYIETAKTCFKMTQTIVNENYPSEYFSSFPSFLSFSHGVSSCLSRERYLMEIFPDDMTAGAITPREHKKAYLGLRDRWVKSFSSGKG